MIKYSKEQFPDFDRHLWLQPSGFENGFYLFSTEVVLLKVRISKKEYNHHLFDMNRGESSVPNIDPGNRRRLPSHGKLGLVLLRQHPRRLHPHQFAFLELWTRENFGLSQNWTSPRIDTIGIVFASPC